MNGSIIFEEPICLSHSPQFFPAADIIVLAPYWDDISVLSPNARLRYAVIDDTNDPHIEQVKWFLSNKNERKYDPLWILVAQWINVCPDTERFCSPDEVL